MSFSWPQIQASLRLEEVEEALGLKIERRGREHWSSCPLPSHGGVDANPSFSIHSEKLTYKCFTCAAGGGLTDLVRQVNGCDHSEALRFLAEFSDADEDEDVAFLQEIETYLQKPERPERRQHHERIEMPWFSEKVHIEPFEAAAADCDWLKQRCLAPEAIKAYRIGYDPERQRRNYVGPAVIIPHIFLGEFVGWQERFLDDDRPKSLHKYMNSDSFPKKETLYGYDQAIASDGPVVVVEGVLTTVALYGLGIPSVATFGASFDETSWQLKRLRNFRHLIFALDNDPAGQKATDRAIRVLEPYIGIDVMDPVNLDKGDLNDLLIEQGPEAVRRQIGQLTPSFLR